MAGTEEQEAAASEIDEVVMDPQVGISRRLQPQKLMRLSWILR
jgi:hypothetical protein